MESSFFSGSENLYKYLVTIGILLMVMTVYYPLKEKQELDILTIKLESDLKILNFKLKENSKNAVSLRGNILKKGNNAEAEKLLEELDRLNQENQINELESERKFEEINSRRQYIRIYRLLFLIFFPTGIVVTIFGFVKWKGAKKYDDNILKLENEKLELEVKKLKEGNQ